MALRPIDYETYHKIFADHLLGSKDGPPTTRVVEVEYYDEDTKWFECEEFDVSELSAFNSAIRDVTIS